MTELQTCEYEMLKEVIKVFEQLDIPYFLLGGSVLGAIKYQGFIPWDDDIDIGLYRRDYEKFLTQAIYHLPSHLFLQNYQTDKEYTLIYSKVRNCNTTYIEKSSAHLEINHGVFIDIFPLDGYPKGNKEQHCFEKRKKIYKLISESTYNFKRSPKENIAIKALRLCGVSKWANKILKGYEKMISQYKVEESDIICNHGNWKGRLEYTPDWYYGRGVWRTFEDIQVRIPEKYDEYLTQRYGDWRSDPPIEDQVTHHHVSIVDLNRAYKQYAE